jgi:hypothetical protein
MVATRIQTDPLETITYNFLKIQHFNAFVNKLRKVIIGLIIIVHCPSVYPHRRSRLYEWKHFVFNSSSFPCVLRTLSIAPYITPIISGEYTIMQYSRLLVTRIPFTLNFSPLHPFIKYRESVFLLYRYVTICVVLTTYVWGTRTISCKTCIFTLMDDSM